jgi:peptidoglycan hydrolase CwlO-like protein
MTDQDKSTIAELAEVIADQNERIRELHEQLDEQNEVIVQYELDQENNEKVDAALYNDLRALLDEAPGNIESGDLAAVLEQYFEDFE